MSLELCQKRQPCTPSFFRYEQNHLSWPYEIRCPKNICFLANRRFEIDDRSVPGELTFERPLIDLQHKITFRYLPTVSIREHV